MEEKSVEFIKWFSELSNKDVSIAGGKGASLAEMYNLKMPIPPGFVVTAQSYEYFITKVGIKERIIQILSNLNVDNTEDLNKVSKKIRDLIEEEEMPQEMKDAIVESYEILNVNKNAEEVDSNELLGSSSSELFVAVRSSATTEDLADASFAGQQDTYLNVRGAEELLEKVKKCMSSLFTSRAIYYRTKKGFAHDKAYLSVVVQKMINSIKSGVMFSKNPTRSDNTIVIEAVWGLGEGIVSGKIKPDHYVVSPDISNFEILETMISEKKIALVRDSEGKNITIKLEDKKSREQVLTSYEIKRLSQYAKQLEEHYKKPQDIEFALDSESIYIVQSRPITTIFKERKEEVSGNIILSGLGASPGVASGVVKVVNSQEDLEKVKEGDVLVTEMTNPDMVVSMQRASAIITDEGGITSHAAIVSREMGIPAVVGTGNATKILKEGDIVTVDGNSGSVYEGKGETKLIEVKPIVPTRTEIKVIVDLPQAASRAALSKARAVGLLRLEGIIATSGKHPLRFVYEGKIHSYIALLVNGISAISKSFEEVWIRTSDIRSDEFQNLEGAPQHVESNPMLGDHGIRFSLKHLEILKAELNAIKKVALTFPQKKFGIMTPQVISVEEVKKTKAIANDIEMPKNVLVGIMVETPAAVQIIEDLCKEGIDFISFGTNDLTQYTLAIDRNNEEVQNIYDETHPAVINSIKHVIRTCKKYGVKTSICGQAGSREDMVKILLAEGIDSISVNADAANKISELVAELEKISRQAKKEDNLDDNKKAHGVHSKKHEENNVKQTHELYPVPLIRTPTTLFTDEDIEDVILKELEDSNEYMPGNAQDNKTDIPPLNDAIPVDSESFEDSENEPEEILDTEWDGEN
ncbi:MAG: phosphoenolpyruvate synthase [Nanoarchaeota archaeon]